MKTRSIYEKFIKSGYLLPLYDRATMSGEQNRKLTTQRGKSKIIANTQEVYCKN
jgi:hypothetical protein